MLRESKVMSDYPRIDVTADIVLLARFDGLSHRVLLIRRKNEPFQGQLALPGGFVNANEKIINAAVRELKEETSIYLDKGALTFFDVIDDVDRDPRGRVISNIFSTIYEEKNLAPLPIAGDDAAEANYYEIDKLKVADLAFDHYRIIRSVMKFYDIKR